MDMTDINPAASDAAADSGRRFGDVILDVKNISLRFGGVKALTDISFDVREHEVRAIIGPNGAGKSEQFIETQVKFEDGRTGSVSATLQIRDAKTFAPVKEAA